MNQKQPDGNPLVVMASGGFIGGVFAGVNNAGTLEFFIITLGASYILLMIMGHIERKDDGAGLGTVLGLSTVIPLPCGFIGMLLGKHLWGA